MNRTLQRDETVFHRFAWDRLSFNVPENWNLSYYLCDKKSSSIRMEDDDSVRMEMEWVRRKYDIESDELLGRYRKQARDLEAQADRCTAVESLPVGWTGFVYDMPEGRCLVALMFLGPDRRFFALQKLHFLKKERDLRKAVVARIVETFSLHTGASVPWAIYDMAFEMDSAFTLINTAFNAGRKMMVFQRKLTRLYVWQFSLADHLLKKQTLAEWAAGFLGTFKLIRAVRFVPQADGSVGTVRKRRHLFGHYDEMGRGCFRYKIGLRRLEAKNAILLWVYSFRSTRDLEYLTPLISAA
jgi:hypothetical protein